MRTALIIILAFLIFGCSTTRRANRHLRIAERHIKKAEGLGAVWHSDTLFKKISFHVPGAEVKFIPKILTTGKPMTFQKDSVITKVLIVGDTVYVETKYPDRVVIKEVPVKIENEIKAEMNFFQKGWPFLLILLIGIAIGYWIRAGPGKNLTVNIKSEKPAN